MTIFKESLRVLADLFGKDCTFVLATVKDSIPSARVVDTYFDQGVFWIVTYAKSKKVIEIMDNPNVALCNQFHTFQGKATNMGHPLNEDNQEIREKLIQVFAPWYFAHNNENDEYMCYVKIKPETGFFHKDGTGYKVNFQQKNVESFPFTPEIILPA